MPDPTPEPCGCKVVYDNPPTAEPWRRPIERIIYCPTHAAAFENERKARRVDHAEANLEKENEFTSSLLKKNAALLAALEEIAKPVLGCADGLVEHKMSIARAAIAKAKP